MTIKKTLTILAALVMTILLAGLFQIEARNRAQTTEELKALAESLKPYEEEEAQLQAAIRNLEQQYKTTTRGPAIVILLFEDADAALYKDTYTILKPYGFTAVYNLKAGTKPGDAGQITDAQSKTLLASGWESLPAVTLENVQTVRINAGPTSIMANIDTTIQNGGVLVIRTRNVSANPADPALDTDAVKYAKLLDYLKEQQAKENLQVLTGTKAAAAQAKAKETQGTSAQKLLDQIQAAKANLEELEKKRQALLD